MDAAGFVAIITASGACLTALIWAIKSKPNGGNTPPTPPKTAG